MQRDVSAQDTARRTRHARIYPGGASVLVEAEFEDSPRPGGDVIRARLEDDMIFGDVIQVTFAKPKLPSCVPVSISANENAVEID